MVLPLVRYSRGAISDLKPQPRTIALAHLHVVPEDLLDLAHPAHIERLRHVDKVHLPWTLHKASVFRRHAEVVNMAPMLEEEVTVSARDEVDDVLGVLRKTLNRLSRAISGDSLRRDLDDGSERAL